MDLSANGTLKVHTGRGLVETATGEALVLDLGSAVQVSGWLAAISAFGLMDFDDKQADFTT